MEPRSAYDLTDPEDRKELARFVKEGVFSYAVLIPEDLPREELVDLFKAAGYDAVEVDSSSWPRQVFVKTRGGRYLFKKVEEGVYRISRE
ncbi:MAG: hypothetical protein ABWK05_06135 [Pyrobaculum sp.]